MDTKQSMPIATPGEWQQCSQQADVAQSIDRACEGSTSLAEAVSEKPEKLRLASLVPVGNTSDLFTETT